MVAPPKAPALLSKTLVGQFEIEQPLNRTTQDVETRLAVLEAMIDGATIETVCNEDGTATTTLTWGS